VTSSVSAATPANPRVNPTVRSVTSLAKNASAAPARPAGYAQRSADQSAVDVAAMTDLDDQDDECQVLN